MVKVEEREKGDGSLAGGPIGVPHVLWDCLGRLSVCVAQSSQLCPVFLGLRIAQVFSTCLREPMQWFWRELLSSFSDADALPPQRSWSRAVNLLPNTVPPEAYEMLPTYEPYAEEHEWRVTTDARTPR